MDPRTNDDGERMRVGPDEPTDSDDEQNSIVLTDATPDGSREFRKERAVTTVPGGDRPTRASVEVDPRDLGRVDDRETREAYVTEVERLRETHDSDDPV